MFTPSNRVEIASASVVIFDYDSTIAKIPVDWPLARLKYRSYLTDHFATLSLPDGARVDEMEAYALQYAPSQKNCVFRFRLELESALDGGHLPLPQTCSLIRELHAAGDTRLFIISNNLKRTVEVGLNQLELCDAFEGILGVDDVGVPKPASDAFVLLHQRFGVVAKNCIFIGDNARTDGGFCREVGIPFINITENSS